MKKILVITMLCLASVVFAQDNPLVAKVKLTESVDITKAEYENQANYLAKVRNAPLDNKAKKDLLDLMIAEVLINQAATRDGIVVTDGDILKEIRKQVDQNLSDDKLKQAVTQKFKVSWDEYVKIARKTLVQKIYLEQKKGSEYLTVPEPSSEEINNFYQTNATQFVNPEMVRANHIFWDTRGKSQEEKAAMLKEATQVQKDIANGKYNFYKMVQQYTQDNNSRSRGGDMGYIARNDKRVLQTLGSVFFQKLFTMKVGELSQVMESNVGYHIVQLNEHLSQRFLKLTDPISPVDKTTVQQYIRAQMMNQQGQYQLQKAVNELVNEIKKDPNTKITIYEENL
ncbi:peptidylprolyl isomerase [Spirochaeta cellobiosiphila]|uniref:peptidylprolyl isomerase n=1 Tax=Spirochaeta cellobiosiphila TaxID=504483 RepID=UPI00040BD874|nr:peptidylprolyl isomerase [Spirochaeta cellobiosiphila]